MFELLSLLPVVRESRRYIIVKADINIYWRYTRMVHGPWAFFPGFRKRVVVLLSSWHSVKFLANTMWARFATSILAPAFHAMLSTENFNLKAKYVTITSFFNNLAFAYAVVRQHALRMWRRQKNDDNGAKARTWMEFFECLLPLVRMLAYASAPIPTFVQPLPVRSPLASSAK